MQGFLPNLEIHFLLFVSFRYLTKYSKTMIEYKAFSLFSSMSLQPASLRHPDFTRIMNMAIGPLCSRRLSGLALAAVALMLLMLFNAQGSDDDTVATLTIDDLSNTRDLRPDWMAAADRPEQTLFCLWVAARLSIAIVLNDSPIHVADNNQSK